MKRLSLSIVIPAYNEANTVERSIREALAVGEQVSGELEVVVCNDGSTDDTRAILDRMAAADPRIRVIHRSRNRGIEASIRALYATARHDYVFLNSADGQWSMDCLLPLAEAVAGGADLVVGRRENKLEVYTPYRRVLSASFERVVRLLGSPVGDPGSIKFGRTSVLRIPVASRGVFAEGERLIRAARAGWRVEERPVDFKARRAGKATGASPKVAAHALYDAIRTFSSVLWGWPRPEAPVLDPDDRSGL